MADPLLASIAQDIANYACREKRADTLQNLNNWLGSTPAGTALASALVGGAVTGIAADKKLSRSARIRRMLQGALAGGAIGGAAHLGYNAMQSPGGFDLSKLNSDAWRNATDTERFLGSLDNPAEAIKNAPGIASIQSHPIVAATAGVGTAGGTAAALHNLRKQKDLAAAVDAAVNKMRVEFPVNADISKMPIADRQIYEFAQQGYSPAVKPPNSFWSRIMPQAVVDRRVSSAFENAVRTGKLDRAPEFISAVRDAAARAPTRAVKPFSVPRLGKYLGLGAAAATIAPMLMDTFWRSSNHPANR